MLVVSSVFAFRRLEFLRSDVGSFHRPDCHAAKRILFAGVSLSLPCLSVFSVSLIAPMVRSDVRHLMWIRCVFLPCDAFRFRENKTLPISGYLEE